MAFRCMEESSELVYPIWMVCSHKIEGCILGQRKKINKKVQSVQNLFKYIDETQVGLLEE